MTTTTHTVERYLRFWNARTPQEQRRLASQTFTDDVRYRAPVGLLHTPDALIDFSTRFAGHMGEVAFRSRREPEIHHGTARLLWELDAGDRASFATGTDVLLFAPDGRIATISTFLDRAPEGFDPDAHHDA